MWSRGAEFIKEKDQLLRYNVWHTGAILQLIQPIENQFNALHHLHQKRPYLNEVSKLPVLVVIDQVMTAVEMAAAKADCSPIHILWRQRRCRHPISQSGHRFETHVPASDVDKSISEAEKSKPTSKHLQGARCYPDSSSSLCISLVSSPAGSLCSPASARNAWDGLRTGLFARIIRFCARPAKSCACT